MAFILTSMKDDSLLKSLSVGCKLTDAQAQTSTCLFTELGKYDKT
jgi:hypothetical protein